MADRVWETLAHIEWGHDFRVNNDVEWMTCRNCGTQMPNDGQFAYPNRCPYFWDGDTLREPPQQMTTTDLARAWLTGDCPMYVEGCRRNHLCQHCLENAQVDFDVDER